MVGDSAPLEPGNRTILKNIPVGTFVYNIEIKTKGGAKLARSAGVYAQVVAHDGGFTSIKLPSTEIRKVPDTCSACIGEVSNEEFRLRNLGKAGRSRHLGIRPKTKQGKTTGGHKTRAPKKYSNVHIVTRRVVRKK